MVKMGFAAIPSALILRFNDLKCNELTINNLIQSYGNFPYRTHRHSRSLA